MNYTLRFIKVFLWLFWLTGCSVKEATPQEKEVRFLALSSLLQKQNSKIDRFEADEIAKRSVYYAEDLAKRYKVLSPPLWQNTLVNLGFKERGLCYEWANDLWLYLHRQSYRTLKVHYIGANIGTLLEHNALSISAKEDDLNSSVVIDAWRDSGKLFFIELNRDRQYKWRERFD
jgi:hypothetical protein